MIEIKTCKRSIGYYFLNDVAQCMSSFWFQLYRIYRYAPPKKTEAIINQLLHVK